MVTSQEFWINARAFRVDRLWGYGYLSCVDSNPFCNSDFSSEETDSYLSVQGMNQLLAVRNWLRHRLKSPRLLRGATNPVTDPHCKIIRIAEIGMM